MATDTNTIMFNVSTKFNDAIDAFIGDANISRALMVRQAVAAHIEYDLSSEPASARRSKYATAEERKQAAKDRAKKRRQLTAKLLAAYESDDSEEAIKALLASLRETEAEEAEEEEDDEVS